MEANCFNNCDPQSNGEVWFYKTHIEENCKLVFDVGSRDDSLFETFPGEVHYFEPDPQSLMRLVSKLRNSKYYLNNFGLSDAGGQIQYFKEHQSFLDRKISQPNISLGDPIILTVKRGDDYCSEAGIESIDFLKIDTEGYEMKVLLGFGNMLSKVKILQFEYGGTFLDNRVRLEEVIELCKKHGFNHFFYLSSGRLVEIKSYEDHYHYCNIACFR